MRTNEGTHQGSNAPPLVVGCSLPPVTRSLPSLPFLSACVLCLRACVRLPCAVGRGLPACLRPAHFLVSSHASPPKKKMSSREEAITAQLDRRPGSRAGEKGPERGSHGLALVRGSGAAHGRSQGQDDSYAQEGRKGHQASNKRELPASRAHSLTHSLLESSFGMQWLSIAPRRD